MRILFQGDSITDANRNRQETTGWMAYGCGYPNFVAGDLCREQPGKHEFINRAVSGDRVVELYARWKRDCLNLKPDFISILVGVNDVWHEFQSAANGVPTWRYEKVLRMLIEETREELPGVQFLLMEPYVLNASATAANYDVFRREVEDRAAAMKRVAEEFNIPFLPLQKPFDDALALAPADYWTLDGVHPSHAGHSLIAKLWKEAFEKIVK